MISYIGGKARIGKWIVPFIPRDIETYMKDDGSPSYDAETEDYPLSTSMLDLIKQSMLAQNLQPLVQMPTDVSNNSKSDVQPNQQK